MNYQPVVISERLRRRNTFIQQVANEGKCAIRRLVNKEEWDFQSLAMADLSYLIDNGRCPSFPLLYGARSLGGEYQLLVEPHSYQLDSLPDDFPQNRPMLDNLLFQLLTGLQAAHQLGYGAIDCQPGSLLLNRVDPVGHWHYTVLGIDFYLPNLGWQLLIDGHRNAKLIARDHNVWPARAVTGHWLMIGDGLPTDGPTTKWNLTIPANGLATTGQLATLPASGLGSAAIEMLADAGAALSTIVRLAEQWSVDHQQMDCYLSGKQWSLTTDGDTDLRLVLPEYMLLDFFTRYTDYRDKPTTELIDYYQLA